MYYGKKAICSTCEGESCLCARRGDNSRKRGGKRPSGRTQERKENHIFNEAISLLGGGKPEGKDVAVGRTISEKSAVI